MARRRRPPPGYRPPLAARRRRLAPPPRLSVLRFVWSVKLNGKASPADAQAYEYASVMGREAFLRQYVGSYARRSRILNYFGWDGRFSLVQTTRRAA